MQIDTLPVHAPAPDPQSGEDRRIAAALLLMNDPADDGRATGWYWTVVPRDPEPRDLKSRQRWTDAVANGQGPFRDANTALAAAGNHTPQGAALAARLEQAAALLRAGEIEATAEAIAEWLVESGPATPVGPDPEARRTGDDPDEVRTMLDGEVPDPDEGDTSAGDEPLDMRETADETAENAWRNSRSSR